MSLKSVVTAGAIALLAVSSTYAGRIETRLDGNDWTLDGLPVLVPNCWNKIDAADGDPGDGNKRKSGCKSVPATTYVRRRGVYSRALPGAKEGRRYFVRCEGASQKATVRFSSIFITWTKPFADAEHPWHRESTDGTHALFLL